MLKDTKKQVYLLDEEKPNIRTHRSKRTREPSSRKNSIQSKVDEAKKVGEKPTEAEHEIYIQNTNVAQ